MVYFLVGKVKDLNRVFVNKYIKLLFHIINHHKVNINLWQTGIGKVYYQWVNKPKTQTNKLIIRSISLFALKLIKLQIRTRMKNNVWFFIKLFCYQLLYFYISYSFYGKWYSYHIHFHVKGRNLEDRLVPCPKSIYTCWILASLVLLHSVTLRS